MLGKHSKNIIIEYKLDNKKKKGCGRRILKRNKRLEKKSFIICKNKQRLNLKPNQNRNQKSDIFKLYKIYDKPITKDWIVDKKYV